MILSNITYLIFIGQFVPMLLFKQFYNVKLWSTETAARYLQQVSHFCKYSIAVPKFLVDSHKSRNFELKMSSQF